MESIIKKCPPGMRKTVQEEISKWENMDDMDFQMVCRDEHDANTKAANEDFERDRPRAMNEEVESKVPEKFRDAYFETWRQDYFYDVDEKSYNKIKKQVKLIPQKGLTIITGRTGCGKTHLMFSLMRANATIASTYLDYKWIDGIISGHVVLQEEQYKDKNTAYVLEQLRKENQILILDDFNVLSLTAGKSDYLFFLIKQFGQHGKSLVIVSNNTLDEVIRAFGAKGAQIEERMANQGGQYIDFGKLHKAKQMTIGV